MAARGRAPPVAELGAGELGGLRGGAGCDVGDAEAIAGHLGLLGRPQQAVGEAGQVQRGPEPVARPGEVPAGRRRVQARVDPAEQHVQRLTSRGQHVRDRTVPRRVHVQLHALNSRQVRVLPAYKDT